MMNRLIAGWVGGAAGAVTVTALHECIRHWYSGAPRLDQMGEEATAKLLQAAGGEKLSGQQLYYTSMIGDVLSNTAYYSGASASRKHPVIAGTALGVLAGIGAVKLPARIGLDPSPTNATMSRQLITIGLYTLGGIISGIIVDRLTRKKKFDDDDDISQLQEKSTLGGAYNTGVTSSDPEEKALIEKQGNFAKLKPKDSNVPNQ